MADNIDEGKLDDLIAKAGLGKRTAKKLRDANAGTKGQGIGHGAPSPRGPRQVDL